MHFSTLHVNCSSLFYNLLLSVSVPESPRTRPKTREHAKENMFLKKIKIVRAKERCVDSSAQFFPQRPLRGPARGVRVPGPRG